MITERTLKNWRRQALKSFDDTIYQGTAEVLARACKEYEKRILRLTQILLDQHLIKGK